MKHEDTITVEWGDDTNLSTLATRLKTDPKVHAANTLAYCVLAVFGGALVIILVCGAVVLINRPPVEAEQIITKCFLPFLQGVAGFWSTIFGPPLWIILGYFFANERHSRTRQRMPST